MGGTLHRVATLSSLLALLVSTAVAQRAGQGKVSSTELQVRVTYENDRPAGSQIRLDLTNESGIPISQTFTDTDGRGRFRLAASNGVYRVKATGVDIEDTMSEAIPVDQLTASRLVFLRAKRKPPAAGESSSPVQSTGHTSDTQITSAASLMVPATARKAFDKGLAEWQNKNYDKAAEQFEKAIAAYPQYDTAYNNLGVMYAHLKQPDKAMTAFERAVQLNDKNADADRNLARMLIRQKNFVRAEDLLKKSLTVQPLDPGSLTMLSISEFENGKVDQALADAHKVHSLPHDGYALSHYVAGQALERKQQFQDATVEYQVYLRESPNGPEMIQVRNALNRLSAFNTTSRSHAQ